MSASLSRGRWFPLAYLKALLRLDNPIPNPHPHPHPHPNPNPNQGGEGGIGGGGGVGGVVGRGGGGHDASEFVTGRLLLSPWSAFKGVFPMHGTYFFQNEVFEDEGARWGRGGVG